MLLAAAVLLLPVPVQGPKGFTTFDPMREMYAGSTQNFARWIVNVGDHDGDGTDDLAASSTFSLGPSVWLISGGTGAIIRSFGARIYDVDEQRFDVVDDADGDGRDDVVIYGTDGVQVLSTATGAVIWLLDDFAFSVCSITDVNMDQVRDIVVTHEHYSSVEVYSGRTGQLLRTYPVPGDHGRRFGHYLDDLGDVNGDGYGDFVVSPKDRALPVIYNGRTSQILTRMPVPGLVSGVGDWDQDGFDDVAYWAEWDPIQVVSVRTGVNICSIGHDAMRLTDVPDMDGDGIRDLFVGQAQGLLGTYCIIGSRWKRIIHKRDGESGDNIGVSMAVIEDLNFDGTPDFALGCGSGILQGRIEFEISHWQPMLSVSRSAVSASIGHPFTFYMRFPPSALSKYRILASLEPGSIQLFGESIPLAFGPLLAMTIRGRYPAMFYGAQGFLSQQRRDATCDVVPHPGELLPLVGRTLHFVAVTYYSTPWNGLEATGFVSSAVSVQILP